jgi:hypothetical protein
VWMPDCQAFGKVIEEAAPHFYNVQTDDGLEKDLESLLTISASGSS